MEVAKNNILIRILKNPIFIMTVLFSVWMIFFDGNGYFNQKVQKEKATALKEQGAFYEMEVEKLKWNIKSMEEDPEALEKFARENYMYKKKGEEIYVVKEKEEKKD
ncbi:MAG: cell division protein FtsB [Flammeovirgaceae bacterium]|jgi:cell division protein DivIC